ncbi:MAG TPA: hypothetical protein VJU58_04105 [Microbacterium sp.]|nr:hypothetical protein [Microbacterium sp.]
MGQSGFSEPVDSEPQIKRYHVRAQGAAAASPTKVFAAGITISRTGVGVWRLQFGTEFIGKYVGIKGPFFEDATASVVKGWTLTATPYDATNRRIDVSIWNSSFAAADLAATSFINFELDFKTTDATNA